MYFNEKEDTNIDSEFEKQNKFDFKNIDKKTLFIIGGVLLVVIICIIIVVTIFHSNKYFIELSGETTMTVTVGDDYIEPGYKAYDKKRNDYTDKVEITNTINTSQVGEYKIIYKYENVTRTRTVKVVEKIDDTVIYLHGAQNIYLEIGEKYIEPGCSASDSIDQDLTSQVKISGTVNSNKPGVYKITYSVVNSRNETTTVTRNVIVVEKGQKP